jgi:hypothetical protein
MANHWAIAVGINQYQFFQPLSYAQRDAQALRNLLVEYAGFSPDRCLLLTENSPPVLGRPTYPSKENLQGWIDLLSRNFLQPGDLLWCFFSGYGVSVEGQDYLVPIEGDPKTIDSTGVPLRSIFSSLKSAPIETSLVLLDMNRHEGVLSDEPIGTQAIQLANDLQIATILSCQPGQFSREAPGLGHGFFTAALLESLRTQQCQTLGSLDQYLQGRLPELSEHYWRPIQQPLTIVNPPERRQQLILPTAIQPGSNSTIALSSDGNPSTEIISIQGSRYIPSPASVVPTNPPNKSAQPVGATDQPGSASQNFETVSPPKSQPLDQLSIPRTKVSNSTPVSNPQEVIEDVDPAFWQRLILVSTTIAALLVVGIFWRNRAIFVEQPKPGAIASSTQLIQPSPSTQPSIAQPSAAPASPSAKSDAKSEQPVQSEKSVPSPAIATNVAPTPSQTVTAPQPNSSQQILQDARRLLRVGQASQYNKAIAKAREIQPNQPLYQEAQQDITRWSDVILNLARRRAERGAFAEAIATAQLVPQDQPKLNKEAQSLIKQWQKKQQTSNGQQLIRQAQGQIQRGQASSYWRAIAIARKIQPNQSEHAQAQKLIAQWSQTMLDLAESRAAQRKYTAAIQTATLVPRNTPAYPAAQKAIVAWKQSSKQ